MVFNCNLDKIPESICSIAPFFLKSLNKIAEANELEGEKGGVIVETLDSGEMLQSVAAFETNKKREKKKLKKLTVYII